jgi:hypothetical protein
LADWDNQHSLGWIQRLSLGTATGPIEIWDLVFSPIVHLLAWGWEAGVLLRPPRADLIFEAYGWRVLP